MLAFASRDWLRVHGEEDLLSDKYSSQALRLLIPILDRPVELLDDTVLAAVVLLRLYEETIGASIPLMAEFSSLGIVNLI
jgi:hypothetical protein